MLLMVTVACCTLMKMSVNMYHQAKVCTAGWVYKCCINWCWESDVPGSKACQHHFVDDYTSPVIVVLL